MTAPADMAPLLEAATTIAQQTGAPVAQTEIAVIGLVSLFEARMQHHFARGPFYQKLSERLTAEGHAELGQSLYQYYLAANVIKRGAGKSHRELLDMSDLPFAVARDGALLVDVTADGFFEGLVATLTQASQILDGA